MMRCLSICLLVLLTQIGFSQTDTAFWFVAPEVSSGHGDRPIYVRFTTLNESANITISQPANAGFSPIYIFVPANTSLTYDLTSRIDILENKPTNQVLNFGLFIRSTAFVTAYYEVAANNNPEIFVLKGRNALGTNFFVPMQTLLDNALPDRFTPSTTSGFDIIATENGTVVTITPTQNTVGNSANVPFTITLNKGQTFSVSATSHLVALHLNGSHVVANKPIAITIKDDSIGGTSLGTCLDLAGEQIVPLTVIGTKYISLPGYLNVPNGRPTDHVFVLATEDNTTVRVNNNLEATLNKGQSFMKNSFNDVFYIEASKPVYVLHLSGFGCEAGHALLPQLDCSGSRTVGFARSLASPLYVNILVPAGGESNFTFNGNSSIINVSQFATVPFTNGFWRYARVLISTAQLAAGGSAVVKNSSSDFHLSIIHGDATTGGRYGYFSGFNKFDALVFSNAASNNTLCAGDSLKLFCDVGAAEGIFFEWTGPNGFTSNVQNPIIPTISSNMAGTYTVVAAKPGCITITKNTSVQIKDKPIVTVNPINPVCAAATVNLVANTATVGAAFSWVGPNGYTSNNQNNTLVNTTPAFNGNYILTTSKDGCSDKDTVVITILPNPSSQITGSANVCKFTTLTLNNNTLLPASYFWSGPNNFVSTQQNIKIDSANIVQAGKYYLLVTGSNTCTSIDSFTVNILESPVINFNALANLCTTDNPVQLTATEAIGLSGIGTFVGNGLSPNGLFSPAIAKAGTHVLSYSFTASNGCVGYKEQPIQIFETPLANAGANRIIIENSSTILGGTNNLALAFIQWTPNYNLFYDTLLNPIASPKQTTIYTLAIQSINGCKDTAEVEVKVLPKIDVPNAFSPNGDPVNEYWDIAALAAFPKCTVQVFDRNGRIVFFNTGYTTKWNGTLNGKPLPVATYYYVIQLNDPFLKSTLSGWVTIIR